MPPARVGVVRQRLQVLRPDAGDQCRLVARLQGSDMIGGKREGELRLLARDVERTVLAPERTVDQG